MMAYQFKQYKPRVVRKYVGSYCPKIDGRQKAMGLTKFFDDMTTWSSVPRMLHCVIMNAPYANGAIVSMDTSKAEALEGAGNPGQGVGRLAMRERAVQTGDAG
jgi:hypothetical protein